MKTLKSGKLYIILPILLSALFLITACNTPDSRVPTSHYYSPGGPFSTNVNDADPRRQIRCTIVFEVIDAQAVEELEDVTFKVRSSVLGVLGELTIADITTHRNLEAISQLLVDRINEELPTTIDLFVRAYFTDFVLV